MNAGMTGRLGALAGIATVVMTVMLANGQEKTWKTPLEADAAGIFEGHGDVGDVPAQYAGGVEYDKGKDTDMVTGGGENIWFDHDAFQYVWKRGSGDLMLAADVDFLGTGKNPHRKAVWMVRQNLEADAAYVDVAVHGVGLTSLQYRDEKGGMTHEVQANVNSPRRVKIVKRGDYFTMWLAGDDGKFRLAGATGKIVLKEPFYVGIGVCSHEKDLVERAVFSKVELKEVSEGGLRPGTSEQEKSGAKAGGGAPAGARNAGTEKLYSMLEIMTVGSTDRRAIYVAEGRFEAPQWTAREDCGDGRNAGEDRNGFRGKMQQRSRYFAGWERIGRKRSIAGRKTPVAGLYFADRGRNTETSHEEFAVVLARLVARRKNSGICRAAEWRIRHLHDLD